jgi:hypothetical protein
METPAGRAAMIAPDDALDRAIDGCFAACSG